MIRSQVSTRALAALAIASLLSACSGGGGGGGTPATAAPTATPTPSPTPSSTAAANAYTCTTSDTPVDVARGNSRGTETRFVARRPGAQSANTGLVEVAYAVRPASRSAESVERANGASFVSEMSFDRTGRYVRMVSVRPGTEAQVAAALRNQPGVIETSIGGQRRYGEAVSTYHLTNDPYFSGFTAAQNTTAGQPTAPVTFNDGKFEEAPSVPGQWDMHAIRLDYAFEYSQPSNGSGLSANANALGSSSIKIALIDSGQDTSHPELHNKVVYQKCFITNTSNVQSSSNFTVDQDGHGTDTAGLAGAIGGNSLGFTGSGGAASLMLYRVFPKPDDNCQPGSTSNDPVCGADTRDIASAINDAVSNGAKVISISLGGGTCPDDSFEGNAVANAIANNVIVVASAGNGGTQGLSTPACDTGVIAAGATSLADGQPNGAGNSNGSASSPTEYVSSYSQFGTTNTVNSASSWGIVAPGGDPNGGTDNDDLHWIENIWTSTPLDSNFSGNCNGDYGNPTGTGDCRTLIAGTSMSAPIVAGAAALILAVNSSYQSPSGMKTLLCQNAFNIGDSHQGCGRLDVEKAMAVAVGDPSPPAAH